MTAFYNEIDPYAAQWIRNLIAAGHVARGVVDERSIEDIKPEELHEFTQCHFFAGVAVWSLALRSAGWADDQPVWTGSCPCQPFSAAGRGAGFADERHLWPAFHHLIAECRHPVVLGEQVASSAVDAWLDLVHADLEALDYSFGSVAFAAAGAGAPNCRERNYGVANAESARRRRRPALEERRNAQLGGSSANVRAFAWPDGYGSISNEPVANVLSPSYGNPGRVGRLRAYGNAINAEAARVFIQAVMECRP